MADFKFEPMRSLIYVDCACEDYRPKLQRWLYKTHVPDSISQFEPYVTKYAFYPSFPMPEGGDRYGYCRMQLTEHHWLVSDLDPRLEIKAIAETFPMDVLVWQGNIPAAALGAGQIKAEGDAGNAARQSIMRKAIRSFSASFPCGGRRTSRAKAVPLRTGQLPFQYGHRIP